MRYLLALLLLLAAPLAGQSSRDFDGTDDEIDCGDLTATEGVDNLTVFGWARLDDDDASVTNVIGKHSSLTNQTVQLRKDASERAEAVFRLGSTTYTLTGSTVFGIAEWNCFVATFDRAATPRLALYLNGSLEDTDVGGDAATAASTGVFKFGDRASGGNWDGQIAHGGAEVRTWSAVEVAEYCRGNLSQAQRAAGGTGGYLPLWDPEADPTAYRGMGLFAGACSATNDPAVSSSGPPVWFPGGGN